MIMELDARHPRVFTQSELPQQMLPMPARIFPAVYLNRRARQMKKASVHFIHEVSLSTGNASAFHGAGVIPRASILQRKWGRCALAGNASRNEDVSYLRTKCLNSVHLLHFLMKASLYLPPCMGGEELIRLPIPLDSDENSPPLPVFGLREHIMRTRCILFVGS